MTTTYPYYTVCRLDAGVLTKLYHQRKFETFEYASDGLTSILNRHKNLSEDDEYVILEYTKPFVSHIKVVARGKNITWL